MAPRMGLYCTTGPHSQAKTIFDLLITIWPHMGPYPRLLLLGKLKEFYSKFHKIGQKLIWENTGCFFHYDTSQTIFLQSILLDFDLLKSLVTLVYLSSDMIIFSVNS